MGHLDGPGIAGVEELGVGGVVPAAGVRRRAKGDDMSPDVVTVVGRAAIPIAGEPLWVRCAGGRAVGAVDPALAMTGAWRDVVVVEEGGDWAGHVVSGGGSGGGLRARGGSGMVWLSGAGDERGDEGLLLLLVVCFGGGGDLWRQRGPGDELCGRAIGEGLSWGAGGDPFVVMIIVGRGHVAESWSRGGGLGRAVLAAQSIVISVSERRARARREGLLAASRGRGGGGGDSRVESDCGCCCCCRRPRRRGGCRGRRGLAGEFV